MSDFQFPYNFSNVTITVDIHNGTDNTLVDTVTLAEPSPKLYVGNMPGSTAAGSYTLIAYNGSDLVGHRSIVWTGAAVNTEVELLVDAIALLTSIQSGL